MDQQKTNVMFMLGLPDSKHVEVLGYDAKGQVIYKWDGNTHFHSHLNEDNFTKQFFSIIWFDDSQRQIKKPDIIVNCINDVDISSKSLAKAGDVINMIKAKWPDVKVFNHPSKVMATSRDKIYQLYKDLPGLHIPKTVRVNPASVKDVFAAIKEKAFTYPLLMRSCGTHQSEGLKMLSNEEEAKKVLETYAYDGQDYYLIQFVDYKSPDNLYRKARLVVIDGQILPRHFMTGEEWMVHGELHDQYMAFKESTRIEEANYLKNFRKMVSEKSLKSLLKLAEMSGLEYIGCDYAIRPDGEMQVFEINPAQNSFIKLNEQVFPYMLNARADIIDALNKAVLKKASGFKIAV